MRKMINMLLKKISGKIKDSRYYRCKGVISAYNKSVKNYGVLESGIYYIDYAGKPIVYQKKIKGEIEQKLGQKSINEYARIKVSRSNQCSDIPFTGHMVMLLWNNAFKVFDFRNNRVATIQDKKKSEKLAESYIYFSPYLRNAYLESVNGYVVEKLIGYKNIKKLTVQERLDVFNKIIDDQASLVNNSIIKMATPDSEIQQIQGRLRDDMLKMLRSVQTKVSKIESFPYARMHGDIHLGNILIEQDTGNVVYIDFEYSREEIIIYDVINTAYVEYVYENNSDLIDYLIANAKVVLKPFCVNANLERELEENPQQFIFRFLVSRIVMDARNGFQRHSERELVEYFDDLIRCYDRFISYVEGKGE